jgi:hypothetical protein
MARCPVLEGANLGVHAVDIKSHEAVSPSCGKGPELSIHIHTLMPSSLQPVVVSYPHMP